jgi:adenosylcobinamide-GDP ribazoletransferase
MMKSFVVMLSFFTRIPLKPRFEIDGEMFARGIKYLPFIAIIIGVPVGALFALGVWTGPYIAALLSLAAYLLISGGLHVDGLADTMDAMGSRRDRETMLAIMKDSHIGTFGALSVCIYVAGMLLCIAGADWRFAGLFALTGRTAALLNARIFPYARPSGMGRGFVEDVKAGHIVLSAAIYIVLAAALCFDFCTAAFSVRRMLVLCIPFIVSLAAAALVARGIARKLGGVTGDVIGFDIELSQLVYLLCGCLLPRLW